VGDLSGRRAGSSVFETPLRGETVDAAIIAFDHIEGADREYASARDRTPAASWLEKTAFIEVHRHDRIVVRGTILGHWVDIEDEGDFIGRDTAVGAVVGGLIGLALGPAGMAAGGMLGGIFGGVEETDHIPTLQGPAFDEIRKDVPKNSSALVVVGEPEDVDAMIRAFPDDAEHVRRYRLSPQALAELEAALAEWPAAAPYSL
jgi:uncharacterized membrane protein